MTSLTVAVSNATDSRPNRPDALEFREVSVRYGTEAALNGLSVRVTAGQTVALLGPSGCGKTTALMAAAGFVPVHSGGIYIDGSNVTRAPAAKRNLGVIFQDYALFPHMSVRRNIEYGLVIRKAPAKLRRQRSDELLQLVGLGDVADRKPGQLSGGQRQRVAMARALAIEPPILLLDEPLSNLDANLRRSLLEELVRLRTQSSISMLYVTHDRVEAFTLADNVAVMNGGVVEQFGPPMELYRAPSSLFVGRFMGDGNFISGQVVDIAAGGATIQIHGAHVRATHLSTDVAVGDEVIVLMRPDDIRLGSADPDTNTIEGTVERVTQLGPRASVRVRTDAGTLTLNVTGDELTNREGERTVLSWMPRRTSVFRASS